MLLASGSDAVGRTTDLNLMFKGSFCTVGFYLVLLDNEVDTFKSNSQLTYWNTEIYNYTIIKRVQLNCSGWKPTHLTSVFALRTSILLPDGTMLTALIQMFSDVRLVGFHPPIKL